jgi:hypothetical protein
MYGSAPRIVLGVRRDLGERDMACPSDEAAKVPICHRRLLDPKVVDARAVGASFFWVMAVGAHDKVAARNEHHAVWFRLELAYSSGLARYTHVRSMVSVWRQDQ